MEDVEQVTLYDAPTTSLEVDEIADWLQARLCLPVDTRGRFVESRVTDELVESFARARVRSPYDRETGSTMYGILRYEERVLDDPRRGGGVMYDGLALQRALNQLLSRDERGLEHAHIVFLDRVIGTWGDHDGRWHKRIVVMGHPAIVSVPGLAEAPAKPEEYYRRKQQSAMLTGDAPPRELLESELEEDVLVEHDPRTTEALKGYALSAIHYLETGESFCSNPQCRLSNPHRHEGVLEAQLTDPAFCEEHAALYRASQQG